MIKGKVTKVETLEEGIKLSILCPASEAAGAVALHKQEIEMDLPREEGAIPDQMVTINATEVMKRFDEVLDMLRLR